MDNPFIIAMCVIVVFIIVVVIYIAKKRSGSSDSVSVDIAIYPIVDGEQNTLINIPIEYLPATTQFDDSRLFEIKDSSVVSRISELIPATVQTATRAMANNAQNALKGMELVKIDIPFSKLTKSKELAGAARGYVHGGRGVAAQANITKVDMTKITKATTVANGVANVMNVGSLVVGQYYMTEISAKLETMSKNIDKINDFQDKEFKSRILSVIALVGEVSDFSAEIIENDEQRQRKISVLENLKGNATELLGQVNITITDVVGKSHSLKYEDYLSKVNDLAMLVGYQNTLAAALEEISKLTYLLGKGGISAEISYATYNKYLRQTIAARETLAKWHTQQVQSLKIDLDNERITKSGFEALVSTIPALIEPKFKSKDLKQGIAQEIGSQAQSLPDHSINPKPIYDEDVEIVVKDGKYYYLRNNSASNRGNGVNK